MTLEQLIAAYALLDQRVQALESGMSDIEALQAAYAAMSLRVDALETAEPPPPSGDHARWERNSSMPTTVFAVSLRGSIPQSMAESGYDDPIANQYYPYWSLAPEIDGTKFTMPDWINDPPATRLGASFAWPMASWEVGDKVAVQYETMISTRMRQLNPTESNIKQDGTLWSTPRNSNSFKFTNLTSGGVGGQITYEIRTQFHNHPNDTTVDMRVYGDILEGVTGRSNISIQVEDPLYTGPMINTNVDQHPGPGSTQRDRDIKNGTLPPHPQNFRLRDNVWVTITYEVVRVEGGSRIRVWLSDDTGTALIIASPANPDVGILTAVDRIIDGLYLEMDTSQEVRFAEPIPDRWVGFRNLVAVAGVSGEDLL